MGLPEIALSRLTPFAATLDGAWQPERSGGNYRKREWHGAIKVEQTFVAVAVALQESTLSWCRARWPPVSELAVRITYTSYGPALNRFDAHLSIGGSVVQTFGARTETDESPIEIAAGALEGGKLQTLAGLPETESAALGVWLVAGSDARSARNHTWHLRGSECEDHRAARIFGGRRNGSLILL